jgi:hypothetical protein
VKVLPADPNCHKWQSRSAGPHCLSIARARNVTTVTTVTHQGHHQMDHPTAPPEGRETERAKVRVSARTSVRLCENLLP